MLIKFVEVDIDILVLSETWIINNNNDFNIENYELFCNCSQLNKRER